jgi:hypothetical protein
MTMAGKIALFVNLALSLMFAVWGFGICSQRVNWTDKKLGEREGKYAIWASEIKQFQDSSRSRVDRRWLESTQSLRRLEALRPKKQEWYNQQINLLKAGDANQKILGIDFDQGQIKMDRTSGLPVMKVITDQANKPMPGLASLQVLHDAYMNIQGRIVTTTAEIEKLVQDEKQLTEQLGDGKVRGLRFDLAQHQLAEKQSLDEQEFLQPLLYNSMVKEQSLKDRQRVLEGRVKEMQTSSVAKQP